MFVGLHKINKKREEEAAINFTNLYVKNIGYMTIDELRELFAVSVLFVLYIKKFYFVCYSIFFIFC